MVFQVLRAGLGFGSFWVLFSYIAYKWFPIPFAWSGWLTWVWFLPLFWATRFQYRTKKQVPGLALSAEMIAAGVAIAFGPLGWISLPFGLGQGLATEWVLFKYKPKTLPLFKVALACAVADLCLIACLPQLQALRQLPIDVWLQHGVGVIGGALAAAWVIRKVTLKNLIGIGTVLFAFLMSSTPLSACETAVDPPKEIVIAVDFDGTVVDTDGFLLGQVIPKALQNLSVEKGMANAQVQSALRMIESARALPDSYTEESWAEDPVWFGFLNIMQVSAKDLWAAMRSVFAEISGSATLPFREKFLDFYRAQTTSLSPDQHIHWLIVTARTERLATQAEEKFRNLEPEPSMISLVSRGKAPGKSSHDNAIFKAESLKQWQQRTGKKVSVFLDNDPINVDWIEDQMPDIQCIRF